MRRSLLALGFLCASSPAFAGSWDCRIPSLSFDEIGRWDVEGQDLISPPWGGDPPGPRYKFRILANSDKGLVAYGTLFFPDGTGFNIVTINKSDGKIQLRQLNVGNEWDDHYEGSCQLAK